MRQEIQRQKTHVKKGDIVSILAGKERGKSGKVISVNYKKTGVLVEKLNMVKRHARPSQKNKQGGVIEKEALIHWSNVKVVTPNEEVKGKTKAKGARRKA